MINVYIYSDPSRAKKFRTKIGEVKTKREKRVFFDGYMKGLYDRALGERNE